MESRRYSISSLSKSFVGSKNSTISDSILLFVEILYLDDPYNKMFTRSSDCQECGGFQGVSIFVQKTKGNEIVTGSFRFGITKRYGFYSITEIMATFIFIQVTKIKYHPV